MRRRVKKCGQRSMRRWLVAKRLKHGSAPNVAFSPAATPALRATDFFLRDTLRVDLRDSPAALFDGITGLITVLRWQCNSTTGKKPRINDNGANETLCDKFIRWLAAHISTRNCNHRNFVLTQRPARVERLFPPPQHQHYAQPPTLYPPMSPAANSHHCPRVNRAAR